MIRAMTGSVVGHYEILDKIGEGGMGTVYGARDLLLNRTAALKFLPADSRRERRQAARVWSRRRSRPPR